MPKALFYRAKLSFAKLSLALQGEHANIKSLNLGERPVKLPINEYV
jgi:hypothetical protein